VEKLRSKAGRDGTMVQVSLKPYETELLVVR